MLASLAAEGANELERIQTHLDYVEQLLRAAETLNLDKNQQTKRSFILDLLHEYWLGGKFPTNRDYPHERRPCFINSCISCNVKHPGKKPPF